MSKDKYVTTFSHQMEAIVFIILKYFAINARGKISLTPYSLLRGMVTFQT